MSLKKDSESLALSQLGKRTAAFKRNSELDNLLDALAEWLEPVEDEIEKQFEAPEMPPLMLVGNPRSGTSVFMQFVQQCDAFAVPTNLLSRFYYAPWLGAKIQDLIFNPQFQFRDELKTAEGAGDLSSDIGKTRGPLSPGEFLHFWRRFLPCYDIEHLDAEQVKQVDVEGLRRGVAAIEAVYGRPFAAKAPLLEYNIDVLMEIFPKALIVYIRRDPVYIMQSILQAREKFYGDRDLWWSVKPPEYEEIKDLDCFHQVAGQVYFTERSIQSALDAMDERHKMVIDYQAFCESPPAAARELEGKYADLGCPIEIAGDLPERLESRNTVRLDKGDIEKLEAAYASFAGAG